jgi:hypothetical protein
MGTTTFPGPWNIHWGSGVSVGVKVNVGTGVSVGERVGVCVGKRMGVTVGYGEAVGEGIGLEVQIGVTVGVAGTMRLNPPQLMRKRVSIAIPVNVFCKCLQWMI